MQVPSIIPASSLNPNGPRRNATVPSKRLEDRWLYANVDTSLSLKTRIKLAWFVFTGRMDAVDWNN